MNLKERDDQYIAHTYKRFPVEIVSGKGSLVFDENGKRYIDMGSGIAVTSFGISDELWVKAVTDQLSRVQHTSNLYYTKPCVDLAQLLCEKTGMKKVFFSNSGAEANECAIKIAREYACQNLGEDYYKIITLKGSFHGRTITTLSATGQEHYHEKFRPMTPGFLHVEPGDTQGLRKLFETEKIAAVLIECIQGEGGVIELDPDFAKEAQEIAHGCGALLMVDEVQTGNGRTGTLYAYEGYGLSPDVVSTAKGLAGGLPLGATMMNEKVENVLGYGDHGSTFGGNPIAAAGAVSILERIDDAFLAQVRRKGELLKKAFASGSGIEAVSGRGLMIGIKTVKPAGEVVQKAMEKGVLCLTAKDKVRLLPALNIPEELLIEAAGIIREAAAL
ncbi:MAG: acetylornithine/succinylornithine family transaminase [Clostridia bacterium]|nr:acetylornithine/succinylornithine family transaminase [Clostridia bacterium]